MKRDAKSCVIATKDATSFSGTRDGSVPCTKHAMKQRHPEGQEQFLQNQEKLVQLTKFATISELEPKSMEEKTATK